PGGIRLGGEADAGPVGARADVDATGVRAQHGQGFDLGGLLLTQGLALGLGPGFATAVGSALGLSLRLPAAGSRAGGRLASDRRRSHRRTPRKKGRRGDGIGRPTTRRCAGAATWSTSSVGSERDERERDEPLLWIPSVRSARPGPAR